MKELCDEKRWTSLAAFLPILLFAVAADGLMDVLGPVGFLAAGSSVMALAWAADQWRNRDG